MGLQHGGTEGSTAEPGSTAFVAAQPARDGKVLRGRDGWLFLAGDTNDVLGQHTGDIWLDEGELARWRKVVEQRKQIVENMGAHYVFGVAPDTHAIYPDKLPEGVEPAGRRPIVQLQEYLERSGSPVRPLYPVEELRRAARRRLVCSPSDSHWNEYGAFVAYSRLMDEIEQVRPVRRMQEEDLIFLEMPMVGDLSYKIDPDHPEPRVVSFARHASAYLITDNCVEGSGAVVETECLDATGTCVFVGDSYAWGMMKLLAESFRRFTFVHMPTFDEEFVAARKPDVVVNMAAERFLIHVPDDQNAPSVEQRIQYKREIGRTRSKAPYWAFRVIPSLEAVERVRGRLRDEERTRDAAIFSLLAYAALEPPEVVSLRWRDVDGDRLTLLGPTRPGPLERLPWIGPMLRRRRLQRAQGRVVPLMDHVREDLERWRSTFNGANSPGDFVFPGATGTYWQRGEWKDWRDNVYRPLAREAGMDGVPPPACRHAMATLMINAGITVEELGAILRLNREQIAARYGPLFFYAVKGEPLSICEQMQAAKRRSDSAAGRKAGVS
jgi:alginate O-acetyltransferase complex protein AlgJ